MSALQLGSSTAASGCRNEALRSPHIACFLLKAPRHKHCRHAHGRHTQVAARAAASHTSDVDVAIVGGGPGGLASANAILSALGPDARVKVFIVDCPACIVFCHGGNQLNQKVLQISDLTIVLSFYATRRRVVSLHIYDQPMPSPRIAGAFVAFKVYKNNRKCV